MKKYSKQLVTFILFLVFIFDQLEYAAPSFAKLCQTPEGDMLWCINESECKPILDVLKQYPQPLPARVEKVLKEYYTCNSPTQVCCPKNPIIIPTPPPPPPSPDDVTHHKNLKLLPEECKVKEGRNVGIVGGQNAGLLEFPFMVLLQFNTSYGLQFQCGGTIINERYILTAAHCLVGTESPLIAVRIGEYNLTSEKDCNNVTCLPPAYNVLVEKILSHPEFNATTYFENDIGLLRVPKIDLDKHPAICLPVFDNVTDVLPTSFTVSGWGFISPHSKTTSYVLQKAELPVQELDVCKRAYSGKPWIKLSYKQWCIGGTGVADTCQGDSGGPLHEKSSFNGTFRSVQHGIVSFGPTYCGSKDFPAVYTKVPYYLKWILDNIEP